MPGPLPTPSAADHPYWEGAREGVLRLPRCLDCERLFFPPAGRCPVCGGVALEWIDCSGHGRIWSWVVFHRQYFPDLPPSYVVVRVQLEEGPFLIANLVEGEPAMDAPVEVVFEETGGIILPQFARR